MRRGRWKRKNVRRDFGRGGPKVAYHTGAGREMVPPCLRRLSHGRGGVYSDLFAGLRGGVPMEAVGARPHLTFFYLRAFRSARCCRVLCGGTGGCGHPPLRGSIGHASVGADTLIGPLQRSPSTAGPAAEKREAEAMRQPPRWPPRRTRGTKLWKPRSPARGGRRPAVFAGTDSGNLRQRGGPLHRSAVKAIFSLGPSTARSLFVKNKKRMGGGMTQPSSWLDSPPNGAHARPPRPLSPAPVTPV